MHSSDPKRLLSQMSRRNADDKLMWRSSQLQCLTSIHAHKLKKYSVLVRGGGGWELWGVGSYLNIYFLFNYITKRLLITYSSFALRRDISSQHENFFAPLIFLYSNKKYIQIDVPNKKIMFVYSTNAATPHSFGDKDHTN